MISWDDLYTVLCAVVPLYVAMVLAYGSVRWWGVLTPDQCAGINRFVAVFAVPLLSFHCISTSDPYVMNLRFIAADTLQKVAVIAALAVWSYLPAARRGCGCAGEAGREPFDWSITLFSISTLPNTLIMGIPLLVAMYGQYSGDLLVQVVVLQCIVWYTLLLVLFEFRAARTLIAGQCPGTAAACIADVRVEPDVVSLCGSQAEAQAEVAPDGRMRLVVRRSTSVSRRSLVGAAAAAATPRPSNLTGVEIYSVSSSRNATPRGSSGIAHADVFGAVTAAAGGVPPHGASSLRMSSFGAADLFSLHPTPRPSSFDEPAVRARSAATVAPASNDPSRDVHMFEWSSGASAASEVRGLPVFHGGGDLHRGMDTRRLVPNEAPLRAMRPGERVVMGYRADAGGGQDALAKLESGSTEEEERKDDKEAGQPQTAAPAGVMMRLIVTMVWRRLIRNPNTYASVVGLTWSLISFRFHVAMPVLVKNSISILSDAGLGMAMFSLGLFMAMQPKIIACGNKVAAVTMAIRFLVGPAIMAATSAVVGLRGTLLRVAIVQAALPQGIVPFVFAKEYNLHAAIICTGVIFGMLIALPIALVYYIILGLL